MSAIAPLLVACPDLQVGLNNAWGSVMQNNPMNADISPLHLFLSSPQNGNLLQLNMSPGNGKIRQVEVVYDVPYAESGVATGIPECTSSTKGSNESRTYTLDDNETVYDDRYFDTRDFVHTCESNPERIMKTIAQLVNVVDRKNSTKIATQAAALVGNWAADVTGVTSDALVVATLQSGGINLNPNTVGDIDTALAQTGYTNSLIFADVKLNAYYKNIKVGCCAESGINLMEAYDAYGKAVVYDKKVAAALGSNQSLAIAPGALQLVNYVHNGWKDGMPLDMLNTGSEIQTVIFSPTTGNPMDLTINYACNKVHIIVKSLVKVFGLPTDLFPTGSDQDGITFVNKIKVTNP